MHLYLSSLGIGDRANELLRLAGSLRAVVVANAVDDTTLEARNSLLQHEFAELISIGFEPEELDLRGYFGSDLNVAERLEGIGLIWVTGGNVFLLRKALNASGLDSYLMGHKDQNILYGGYSAGVCVLSPTLRGLEIVDDQSVTADGYPQDVIWEGLNLVPFSIAPHYTPDHSGSTQIDTMIEYFIEQRTPFIALRDGGVEVWRTG